MTLYIGVDIHARQQTVSYLETGDGTTGQVVFDHEIDDVKEFYRKLQGEVIIGIEACGYTNWSVELWLVTQAKSDVRVRRLQTHPGVGLLTSLCVGAQVG